MTVLLIAAGVWLALVTLMLFCGYRLAKSRSRA